MPRDTFNMADAMKKYNNTATRNSNAYRDNSGSRLGFGGKIIKGAILIFNLVLLIMSFGMIIGAGVNLNGNYIPLVNTWLVPVIVLGAFLLVISAIGGICALRESICWLWVYSALLSIIGIAIVASCAYALSFAGSEDGLITQAWKQGGESMRDSLQITYHCCGLAHYADSSAAFPCPPPGPENATVASAYNYTGEACLSFLVRDFRSAASVFPSVGLAMFALLVLVAVLVCCLVRSIAGSRSHPVKNKEHV